MMFTQTDILYAVIWFLCGLVVFQTRGASKTILAIIGGVITGMSIVSLWLTKEPFYVILGFIVMNKVTGIFTDAFYFLGANISRGQVMNRWSVNRIIFNLILVVIWGVIVIL